MVSYSQQGTAVSRCILIISALDFWSMGKGKGGPALWRTIMGYANRGWEVYFITGNRAQDNPPDLPDNVHVIRFDMPWLRKLTQIRKIGFFFKIVWWGYFQLLSFIKAQKIHAKRKFNVVYGYEIYGVPVAKVLSKLWHAPIVSRFQGTSFGAGWVNKRFRKIRAWEHFVGLRIPADLVIMTNDGTQGDRVLKQLGVDITKLRFWLNGVDWDLFNAMPDSEEAKELLGVADREILLCISRLVKWKRVDRSIRALPEVVKDYPDTLLLVVGDGLERGRLEKLARNLGIERNVRFEGAVPHSEIPKYLAAADIFLSFYDWTNVGNPLLEAMMAGKCIITLNNGDTGKFVENWENGVLLNYEDLPKLPEVIKRFLADRNLRERLGANARKFAEENFWTWEERMDAEVQAVKALLR